jgi:hypothetical protein
VHTSEKISFEILELEMADLEHFWNKKPLGLSGIKVHACNNEQMIMAECVFFTSIFILLMLL